ncbi:MAG: DegT/DnrJ/EryC1/StrS family aminotransferase [Cytophagales bacterium]|nr:DegT/DnrJ/EryC1/StrS family aminotransferase [Bernardetiaceae bacterium]MDW8211620.1 DegT/DnrJ/EryC1/StrS family aminotransferase [Cytophagales bacterium]
MIPVFEPEIGQEEKDAVADALQRGEISGSFGQYIPNFERAFADYCGVKHGVAVSSGTTALQLAVRATGIGKGDEVLISASTNIATALAVIYNNAIPVPVDSEPVTWNLDLSLLESKITPRTKAIIPVHLYGHPVDMDQLMEIAQRHGLIVIEDAAEAHGAEVRGKKVGSFGNANCFSFYANKIITTGEGGMVLTNDDQLADKLRLLRNLAFTKPRFRHEVAGYNFRMTGMQAAMGLAQTRKLNRIISQKIQMAAWYNAHLADIPGITLPRCQPWAKHVYWMYGILIDEKEFGMNRDELAEKLYQHGVETRTFFCPMNLQPCLRAIDGFRPEPCPVAEKLWETGLYLPSSHTLSEETIARIAQIIRKVRS